jgi:curli biogenesis system outer membrane secretion channel CsgG
MSLPKFVTRICLVSALAGAAFTAGPAFAGAYGTDNHTPSGTPDLPQCARPIGTVAIKEPERDWWTPLGLSNPEALLKLFAGRSNCLRVVARGEALQMRNTERELGDSGELQRGQNFGKGQVVAADYLIIPDIVDSNRNSGGGGLGALGGFGHLGGFGAALGSINFHSSEAHTLITLINARTTEQEYVAEGTAKKTDIGFGGGGGWGSWGGGFAALGGGYSNTDIGKVISAAYLNAFVDLIGHMQGEQPGTAAAAAPIQAYTVTDATMLKATPSPASKLVRSFKAGDLVYPTGNKNGVWWEVDDENGNRGWVTSTHISPRG